MTDQITINRKFREACEQQNFTQALKLANSTACATTYNQVLWSACTWNKIAQAKFILTHRDLPIHASIHCKDSDLHTSRLNKGPVTPFENAVYHGNKDIIDFLLFDESLVEKADINSGQGALLTTLARLNNVKLLEFYLEHPKLATDIHIGNDAIFKMACLLDNKEVLDYLIFDWEIALTPDINLTLQQPDNLKIAKMFNKRILKDNLEKKLSKKEHTHTFQKI